ncbi:MAG: hypothetical protein CMK72_02095, partial [Pseudomonadaceae bacterium]|nr:hypothetical protein [Pseudomonadaceae bacterium]
MQPTYITADVGKLRCLAPRSGAKQLAIVMAPLSCLLPAASEHPAFSSAQSKTPDRLHDLGF